MAFQTKKPPIRIMVDIDTFNNLVELVSIVVQEGDERNSKYAEKMKEKLLKYSIPRVDENGETNIDIRFYNNEAQDLIYFLMATLDLKPETDYYEVLKKVRESFKQNTEENE